MRRTRSKSSSKYDSAAADHFWSKRLHSTDPLSAVLSYGAPKVLNQLYDRWERQALAKSLPRSLHNRRALDIGAGIGRISLILAKLGAETTSVDISSAMLKRLSQRARTAGQSKCVHTIQSSSHEIPLPDRAFDIVTCLGLLEHLPEPVRRATVAEAARLVKRSGKIYMVVNNVENPFLSRNYPLKRQRSDGYFVSLVGLPWLRKTAHEYSLSLRILAANPWYSLVHYHLYPYLKDLKISPAEFNRICRFALKLDDDTCLPTATERLFASHFLVELRKR